MHPGLLSMKLLFFKVQFLGFPPMKNKFFFSYAPWTSHDFLSALHYGVSLALCCPNHPHRLIRPMELSHLQACDNKLAECLSATPVVVRPDEVSGWPPGGSQLPPNVSRELYSKDARFILSTSHQKQYSSSFFWTYKSPLWGSPSKFSKFVFRVLLQTSYKNWQCLTNNLGKKDWNIFFDFCSTECKTRIS